MKDLKHVEIQAGEQEQLVKFSHGSPWAKVSTVDGLHVLHVAIGSLHYDQDGDVYLHCHDEHGEPQNMYLRNANAAEQAQQGEPVARDVLMASYKA